jgi:Tfp pilus assembly protein PilO
MARIALSSLPTKSLMYLLIFGGGIAIFVLMVILPAQNTAKNLDLEIGKIKSRIEEQKILSPVYKSLKKKSTIARPEGLIAPEKEKLDRGDTRKITSDFQKITADSGLNLAEFRPDVNTILNNAEFLKVNILIEGEFFDLQNFLIQVCQLPYLELIEIIKINPVKNTNQFGLQIWMLQE